MKENIHSFTPFSVNYFNLFPLYEALYSGILRTLLVEYSPELFTRTFLLQSNIPIIYNFYLHVIRTRVTRRTYSYTCELEYGHPLDKSFTFGNNSRTGMKNCKAYVHKIPRTMQPITI